MEEYFTKNTYDSETKRNTVQRVLETKDYQQVSRETGICNATIYSWIKNAGHNPRDFNSNRRTKPVPSTVADETKELKEKIEKLENDMKRASQIIRSYRIQIENVCLILGISNHSKSSPDQG